MTEQPLSKEMILDTAEQTLRRFGLEKATVVDVARALGVSHGTVYRHFPSKATLRAAVAERWLHGISAPLADVFDHSCSAADRLRLWFDTLIRIKRTKAQEDPELFTVYSALVAEAVDVVHAHVTNLVDQVTRIVEEGIAAQEFTPGDAGTLASAVFMATARFHHPALANEWGSPAIDQEFNAVWNLILSGILAG